jgi:hypothetical protein
MLTIRCAKCRDKIFKYQKMGKGRVLRCYKAKIIEYYTHISGTDVKCKCGNLLGKDEGIFIKMKQSSFIYSGTITK